MRMTLSRIRAVVFIVILISVASTLYSKNQLAETQTDERKLQIAKPTEQQSMRSGRYYALVIGNNDYVYLSQLKTACKDAEAVANILRDQYDFEVRLLVNAKRNEIMTALNDYRRALDDSANLLIYYAGHGHHDREVDQAYWLPVDAQKDNNVNWVSAHDITDNIKGMRARHILIISDSCYSGMIPRDAGVGLTPAERSQFLRKMRVNRGS